MFEKSFIEKCLDGEADIFELDNYIEFWHTHDTDVSLRDFLGLTPYEYERFFYLRLMWGRSNDSIFRDILRCRMDNTQNLAKEATIKQVENDMER